MMKSTIPAILENILKNQSRAKYFLNGIFKIRTRGILRPELAAHNKNTRNNYREVILCH